MTLFWNDLLFAFFKWVCSSVYLDHVPSGLDLAKQILRLGWPYLVLRVELAGSFLDTFPQLAIPVLVNKFQSFTFTFSDKLLSVLSYFMALPVISSRIYCDHLKFFKELPRRSIVLIRESCIQQIKPHLLGNDLAILVSNLLLDPLLKVNQVLSVFLHVAL